MIRRNVTLDQSVYDRARAAAHADGRSFSSLIRVALIHYIESPPRRPVPRKPPRKQQPRAKKP